MVGCNQTRKMIDEADHPELLPFEASSHVSACADCGGFAEERQRLRRLLLSGTRVGVPMKFDAVLRSRLAEAKSRSSFAWLSPAGSLRLGGAVAALVVMVLGAQYAGLFGSNESVEQRAAAVDGGLTPGVKPVPQSSGLPSVIVPVQIRQPALAAGNSYQRVNRYQDRTARAGVPLQVAGEDYLHEDAGVMLVRGSNGEGEVALPMVSVGAQSRVYASAGRRTTLGIGASF